MLTQKTSMYGIASRVIGFTAAAALSFGSQLSFAQGPAPQGAAPAAGSAAAGAPAKKKGDDKLDISDLENKYWAPKDTDFSVVQNRTYTKEGRFFATVQAGRPINDQWAQGNIFGGSLNYFWSERFGIQATYLKGNLKDNDAADRLAQFGSGVRPDHNRFNSYYGVGVNVVPFYAKMSFWGKKIIYFDMAFTPTIGFTNYDQSVEGGDKTKGAFTYGIDITQYFFFTNYFAIRADLKNNWYNADIARFRSSGGIATGDKVNSQTTQDTQFLLGVTFFY